MEQTKLKLSDINKLLYNKMALKYEILSLNDINKIIFQDKEFQIFFPEMFKYRLIKRVDEEINKHSFDGYAGFLVNTFGVASLFVRISSINEFDNDNVKLIELYDEPMNQRDNNPYKILDYIPDTVKNTAISIYFYIKSYFL